MFICLKIKENFVLWYINRIFLNSYIKNFKKKILILLNMFEIYNLIFYKILKI
jgi:hypothetical protein